MPGLLRYFLTKVKDPFDYLFNKWLVRVLCADFGKVGGLTPLPQVDNVTLDNLNLIRRVFKRD